MQTLYAKAWYLFLLGQYDNSLACCDTLLKYDFDNQTALNDKGLCLVGKQLYSEALKIFNKGRKLYPNNLHFINNIGVLYSEQDSVEKAIAYYDKCISISKRYILAISNKAQHFMEMKRFKEADLLLDSALNIENSDFTSLLLKATINYWLNAPSIGKEYIDQINNDYILKDRRTGHKFFDILIKNNQANIELFLDEISKIKSEKLKEFLFLGFKDLLNSVDLSKNKKFARAREIEKDIPVLDKLEKIINDASKNTY